MLNIWRPSYASAASLFFSTGRQEDGPSIRGSVHCRLPTGWLPLPRLRYERGVGCMFVLKVTLRFWHGSATAWSGESLQFTTRGRNLKSLESSAIKKNPEQEEAERKQIKETFLLSMFSIRSRNLALSSLPPLLCVWKVASGDGLGQAAGHM